MSFFMREYTSEDKYDLAKFFNFEEGVYDVLDSPFLLQLKQLPTVSYYYTRKRFKEIDLIAVDVYDDSSLAPIIKIYNDEFRDVFDEDTVLKLFALTDLEEVYYNLVMKSNSKKES